MESTLGTHFQKIDEDDILIFLLIAEFLRPSTTERRKTEIAGLAAVFFVLNNIEQVGSMFSRAVRHVLWKLVELVFLELTGVNDAIEKLI